MPDETKIVRVEPAKTGITAMGTQAEIVAHMEQCSTVLNTVHEWIKQNFEPNIDYGIVDDRSGKETLKKPGAEKVCNYFHTTPRWARDTETWEMLGSIPGNVCYICQIVSNSTSAVIGEGRGAWSISDKPARDINKGIKTAKKRAMVDAVLTTFCLSERFTQDSPEHRSKFADEKEKLKNEVASIRRGIESSLTNNQFLHGVAKLHLHESPSTIGAIRELRRAIIDLELYDLATGERIPE